MCSSDLRPLLPFPLNLPSHASISPLMIAPTATSILLLEQPRRSRRPQVVHAAWRLSPRSVPLAALPCSYPHRVPVRLVGCARPAQRPSACADFKCSVRLCFFPFLQDFKCCLQRVCGNACKMMYVCCISFMHKTYGMKNFFKKPTLSCISVYKLILYCQLAYK